MSEEEKFAAFREHFEFRQLSSSQSYDGSPTHSVVEVPERFQKFQWMPEWKLPDWATGRLFYFATLGVDTTVNKVEFDDKQRNRCAGSLVGAPLNLNHIKYDLSGFNIVVDAEVEDNRMEGLVYVEDATILELYDNDEVIGVSIDYRDRNIQPEDANFVATGTVCTGLGIITAPWILGDPTSRMWEATHALAFQNIEQKVMAESMTDFVDKELLIQRTVVFQGYVGGHVCAELTKSLEYLGSVGKEPIKVILNSGGGSVYAGLLVFDTIRRLTEIGIEVTCEVRGLAASMGAIILQAATHRVATPNTRFLIHEVSSWAWGKTSEMEEEIREIKKVNDMLRAIIAERTKKTPNEIEAIWHKRDVWLSADEALDFGLIDEIIEGGPKAQTLTTDELVTSEVWFGWLNSIELRMDGLLAKALNTTEVFKRLAKEEKEEDDDDDNGDDDTQDKDPTGLGEGTGTKVEQTIDRLDNLEDLVGNMLRVDGRTDHETMMVDAIKLQTDGPLDEYFAFIEGGGELDETERTMPRELRHMQMRDHEGFKSDLLESAAEELRRMVELGKIGPECAETARERIVKGFEALGLAIPDWMAEDGSSVEELLPPHLERQLSNLRAARRRVSRPMFDHRDRRTEG